MEKNQSYSVKFFSGEEIPLELHKVRIVQKLNLIPIEERLKAIVEGGFNTFLLTTKTVFLDMLTDSGTNAMSDNQVSSMLRADDAYAGSQSYMRLEESIQEVFNCKYYLPVHQGRAVQARPGGNPEIAVQDGRKVLRVHAIHVAQHYGHTWR